jgi:hypothetical protein
MIPSPHPIRSNPKPLNWIHLNGPIHYRCSGRRTCLSCYSAKLEIGPRPHHDSPTLSASPVPSSPLFPNGISLHPFPLILRWSAIPSRARFDLLSETTRRCSDRPLEESSFRPFQHAFRPSDESYLLFHVPPPSKTPPIASNESRLRA